MSLSIEVFKLELTPVGRLQNQHDHEYGMFMLGVTLDYSELLCVSLRYCLPASFLYKVCIRKKY